MANLPRAPTSQPVPLKLKRLSSVLSLSASHPFLLSPAICIHSSNCCTVPTAPQEAMVQRTLSAGLWPALTLHEILARALRPNPTTQSQNQKSNWHLASSCRGPSHLSYGQQEDFLLPTTVPLVPCRALVKSNPCFRSFFKEC